MEDFKFEDFEEWSDDEFLEENPWEYESVFPVELHIDWVDETTEVVVSRLTPNSYAEYYGNCAVFDITDVDFSQFGQYYNEKIRPIVVEISEHFYQEYDGHNMRGYFNDDNNELNDVYPKFAETEELINRAPKLDKMYAFNLSFAFNDSFNIFLECMEEEGVDFLDCDLDDPEIYEKVYNRIFDCDEFVYFFDVSKKDLKEIQENESF